MTHTLKIVLGLIGVFIAAVIFWPVYGRAPVDRSRSSCQTNLKQIGLGLMQYTQDYGDKMPSATRNVGWANAIQPYLKSLRIYQCPSEKNGPTPQSNPRLTGYIDYFYNTQIENQALQAFNDTSRTIAVGEGNEGNEVTNASYGKRGLPATWRSDPTSPAFRHLDYANYLFMDGHVKSEKETNIFDNWNAKGFFFQGPKY